MVLSLTPLSGADMADEASLDRLDEILVKLEKFTVQMTANKIEMKNGIRMMNLRFASLGEKVDLYLSKRNQLDKSVQQRTLTTRSFLPDDIRSEEIVPQTTSLPGVFSEEKVIDIMMVGEELLASEIRSHNNRHKDHIHESFEDHLSMDCALQVFDRMTSRPRIFTLSTNDLNFDLDQSQIEEDFDLPIREDEMMNKSTLDPFPNHRVLPSSCHTFQYVQISALPVMIPNACINENNILICFEADDDVLSDVTKHPSIDLPPCDNFDGFHMDAIQMVESLKVRVALGFIFKDGALIAADPWTSIG